MKLLLTSGGITNKSISKALFQLAGKPAKKLNLAFIPTASNIEDVDKSWLINDLSDCKNLGFSYIDIVDISALPLEIWKPRLEKADIIYFGGGDDTYLIYWMEKSGLAELLPKLLKTRVYVGVSAGSMAITKYVASEKIMDIYDEKGRYPNAKGLSLTNFFIMPHLNSKCFKKMRSLDNIKKVIEGITDPIYAIDDETAIKVVDGKVTIISEGKWKRFN